MAVRHDVAIYTASSATAGLYDRSHGRAGGAELQMTLLARSLAGQGHRVAHIIYPPKEPVDLAYPLTLVHRGPYAGDKPLVGGLLEVRRIWRALRTADARVIIVRTASPAVGAAAFFCRLHRRSFIFSSSNISDFTLEKMSRRLNRSLYRLGVRLADAVVVQSEDQIALARDAFPSLRRVAHIPSFAEPAPPLAKIVPRSPKAFLWFGRFVGQKQPMEYLRLARSVPEARFLMIAVPEDPSSQDVLRLREAVREITNLELLEPLPREELAQVISSAVAVVNTSVLEGMPNAFLEAWARGVPVLTLQFDPDGVVDRHGLGISAGGSWDRFVEGARDLWTRRDRREDVVRRLRAYVEETHPMEGVAARWSELVAEVNRPSAPADGHFGSPVRD